MEAGVRDPWGNGEAFVPECPLCSGKVARDDPAAQALDWGLRTAESKGEESSFWKAAVAAHAGTAHDDERGEGPVPEFVHRVHSQFISAHTDAALPLALSEPGSGDVSFSGPAMPAFSRRGPDLPWGPVDSTPSNPLEPGPGKVEGEEQVAPEDRWLDDLFDRFGLPFPSLPAGHGGLPLPWDEGGGRYPLWHPQGAARRCCVKRFLFPSELIDLAPTSDMSEPVGDYTELPNAEGEYPQVSAARVQFKFWEYAEFIPVEKNLECDCKCCHFRR